jgi:hypothetical protein
MVKGGQKTIFCVEKIQFCKRAKIKEDSKYTISKKDKGEEREDGQFRKNNT